MSSPDDEVAMEAPGGSVAAAELVRLAKRRIAAQAEDPLSPEEALGVGAGEWSDNTRPEAYPDH